MKRLSTKEIQKVELDILIDIARFCDKNKITYFLGCGTLAGAILEKGFFSWDDDIDLLFKRKDYERFLKIYKSDRYKVLTCDNKDYYYPYAKVVDTKTLAYECKNKIDDYGVFVDLFPLDFAPNMFYINMLKPLRILMMSQWGCYLDDRNIVIRLLYKVLSILTLPLPKNYFAKVMNKMCMKKKGNLMGVTVFHKYNREIMSKEIFDEIIDVMFEGHKFKTIKRYEEYLNNLYIDYKQENKKVGHKHFIAYWK